MGVGWGCSVTPTHPPEGIDPLAALPGLPLAVSLGLSSFGLCVCCWAVCALPCSVRVWLLDLDPVLVNFHLIGVDRAVLSFRDVFV